MAESTGLKLDKWGHVETYEIKPRVFVGVLERNGEGRIVVSLGNTPDRGYDLAFGYQSVEDASIALQGWDYDSEPEPPDCIRNYQTHPIED